MKRLFSSISSFSEESDVIIKRARLLISSISSTREISEEISLHSSNSENQRNINDHSCQLLENSLIIISDSEDDQSSSSSVIEYEPELIDLITDDQCSIISEHHQTSIDIEYCPICLEYLSSLQTQNINLVITPCNHVLCTLCSQQLLLRSSCCPLCRQTISTTSLMPYCILT